MIYQVSILEKNSGKCYVRNVEADNYPNAVKDAMIRLGKEMQNGEHFVQNPKTAPRL